MHETHNPFTNFPSFCTNDRHNMRILSKIWLLFVPVRLSYHIYMKGQAWHMATFDGKFSLLSCCKAAMCRHKTGLARSRHGINRRICCKLHNDIVEKSEICYIARARFFLYTGFIENLFLINLDGASSLPYCLLPQGPLHAPAMLASPLTKALHSL